MKYEVLHGDCLAHLRDMPDNSIDAVVTDPPYGLSNTDPKHVAETLTKWVTGDHEYTPPAKGGFMGKAWDSFVPPPAVWDECMRVLKPGGHLLVFAGTRTQDLMGLSIRLAGFDIRDGIGWIYGSGFPKSMDISKAIDKAAGAERAVVGVSTYGDGHVQRSAESIGYGGSDPDSDSRKVTAPATPDAARWAGWGTALKPAIEPVIVARKPIRGTVAANVLEWGTGALNIDASRVGPPGGFGGGAKGSSGFAGGYAGDGFVESTKGRWPANVLLDPEAAAAMDQQSGITKDGVAVRHRGVKGGEIGPPGNKPEGTADMGYGGTGGASRFFPVFKYQAKAPKKERPVIEREDGTKVQHPTVKPLALMEWLITLVTPPGGTVLDPFAGSGTTLQAARDKGFQAIGIEADADYCELIHERLKGGQMRLDAAATSG